MATPQSVKGKAAPPPPVKGKSTAVAAPSADSMVHLQKPEWLAKQEEMTKTNRGSENVGVEDIIIPRLEIVQALSPCKKRNDPMFIDGAEDGMLYNNVTKELYGDDVLLLPIFFRKEYLIWKDRQKGGGGNDGFRGSFSTPESAAARVDELEGDGDDFLQIVDTAQQFCLLVHGGDRIEEVVVSMARSKMKVSRRWNSLIRLTGGDRFSRIYKMATAEEKGKKGEYYNFNVEVHGFPSQALYKIALDKYQQIAQNSARVKADISGTTYDVDDEGSSQDGTARSKTQDY